MALVEIKGVFLQYDSGSSDDVLALNDINLDIEEGEFVVVLGASGCGKTSLLNLLAGFLFPSKGEITVDGHTITRPGHDRGVVFQKHALMPWLSVRDNVEFGLKLRGVDREKRIKTSDQCLEWVGLQDFGDHYIYQLSGGMQQRVGMARALANDPAILLMDEPLGALDAITREEVQTVVLKVWEKTKKTIFMITHSIEEALFMATRLVIMTPRPGEIFKEYSLDFGQRFLDGTDPKEVKELDEFLEIKGEILQIVQEKAQ